MNREQVIFILIGILILAGMLLCVPVGFHMMSLYFYCGYPNAGMNLMTFYRFMPEGWPKCINYGVLFWQCFFLGGIISCLFFVFRKDIKKSTYDIKKGNKMFLFMLMSASILFFLLWFVETSFGNVFRYFKLGLLIAGLLGFAATIGTIDVYVAKKRTSELLQAVLTSCTILAFCMVASYFGHRYSPNKFQFTPNMWRLSGGLAFLGIWVFYVIYQFIQQKKGMLEND